MHFQANVKGIIRQLLATQKDAQERYLRSLFQKEGKCWTGFYKFVKRRKGNMENIPAIKDCNDRIITHSIGKASSLNFHYTSVFGCERNIPQIKQTHSGEPFNGRTAFLSNFKKWSGGGG